MIVFLASLIDSGRVPNEDKLIEYGDYQLVAFGDTTRVA